jgi:hypothetical protein
MDEQENRPHQPYGECQACLREQRDYERTLEQMGGGQILDTAFAMQEAAAVLDILPGEREELKDILEDTPLARLNQELEIVKADTPEMGDDERARLVGESETRLFTYAGIAGELDRKIENLRDQTTKDRRELLADHRKVNPAVVSIQHARKQVLEALETFRHEDLPRYNPEAFLAENLIALRRFAREYDRTGIVSTETVRMMHEKIKDKLAEKNVVALVGETGAGKTQMAKKVAREHFEESIERKVEQAKANQQTVWEKAELDLSEEEEQKRLKEIEEGIRSREEGQDPFYFVRGHKYTTKEDLLSHLGLKVERMDPLDAAEQVREAQEQQRRIWQAKEELGEETLGEQDKAAKLEHIKDVVLGQAQQATLTTGEMKGVVEQARDRDVVLIIDEFTYMDPGLLASLNEYMQEGVKIIFTGNLNMGSTKKYLDRQELDPALIDRLNSSLLEYSTPPQDDIDTPGARIDLVTDEEYEEGSRPERRELFQIALAQLIDQKGNLQAPEEAMDEVWRMTQAFSIFQAIFAGKEIKDDAGNPLNTLESTAIKLEKSHASMRAMNDIIQSWKADGFSYPIEYYLYDYFLRPSSVIAPREAAFFYRTLVDRYGFFEDNSIWDDVIDYNSGDRTLSIRNLTPEQLSALEDNNVNLRLYQAQEVAEAFCGVEMPEQIRQFDESLTAPQEPQMTKEEMMTLHQELEEQMEQLPTDEQLKEAIKLFCQDLRNIDKNAFK